LFLLLTVLFLSSLLFSSLVFILLHLFIYVLADSLLSISTIECVLFPFFPSPSHPVLLSAIWITVASCICYQMGFPSWHVHIVLVALGATLATALVLVMLLTEMLAVVRVLGIRNALALYSRGDTLTLVSPTAICSLLFAATRSRPQ
jgi:hypothetical protein